MLERAAVGLESGTLQRVLPRTNHSARHSSAIASRLCKRYGTLTKESEPERGQLPKSCPTSLRYPRASSTKPGSLEPSRPLDFLYPTSTRTLLADCAGNVARPRSQPRNASYARSNSYSSTSLATRHSREEALSNVVNITDHPSSDFNKTGAKSRWTAETVALKDTYTLRDDEPGGNGVDEIAEAAAVEANRAVEPALGLDADLAMLLDDNEGDHYREVWDAYCHLKYDQQTKICPRVVVYLSRSQSVVETGRAMSLLRQVDSQYWDNDFLSAAMLILLRSGDQLTAISYFKRGVELRGLTGGFEYLLLDGINKQQWARILDAWGFYYDHVTAADAKSTEAMNPNLLNPLGSLPSLGALYFAFERHLAIEVARGSTSADTSSISSNALRVFRRRFATEALKQPCPPKQALTILEFWQDQTLYNNYLDLMFTRWYNKEISNATARFLLPIYHNLQDIEGATPIPSVLKGVYHIHYPQDAAALKQLHKDWIRYHGNLSRWAFDKFLKFYAQKGDPTTVRELWAVYVKRYPKVLTTPAAFRSTMNVYAQTGDVENAEKELERMTKEYNVEPDLSTWNMLLKCYVRADDYGKVLATFDEIRTLHEPDSFTYTHVMAMASKKGDLDAVLSHFNAAQEAQVRITKEMALSIVVAYCHNNKLTEAEDVCIELAQRAITSTAMWNQLLHFNGMQGKLKQCYTVLNHMKRLNLEWDPQTISFLLRALVQVGEIHPAYHVVRDGAKNKLHILRPDHFVIVILGAVKTHERHIAENLISIMEDAGMPIPFNVRVAYAQGAVTDAPNTVRDGDIGKDVLASLDALAENYQDNSGDMRQRRQDTASIGQAVKLLVELRDFTKVEMLLTTFEDIFPQYKDGGAMHIDVVAALMLAYDRDGNYGRVHELWRNAWPAILKRSAHPDGEGIYPAHQYDITKLVYRRTKTFAAEHDGDGILKMVEEVTEAGFKLTSGTWDRIIRTLARLGHWERAMVFCEKILMPNWQGWRTVKRDLTKDIRMEKKGSRYLEPTPEAILALQEQWLKTRRLAAWSEDIARKLDVMEQNYPLLHDAFLSSSYGDGQGPNIFRRRGDPAKVVRGLLAPLSVKELRRMQKRLEKQLKDGKGPGASSGARERRSELTELRAALFETLAEKGQ